MSGRAPRILPYGSWPSPIDSGRVGAGTLRLSQPQLCDGRVYWLEGRPAEQGRQVVMRAHPGGLPEPLTPSGKSVRTRVHEYGGGDFLARDGRLFAIDAADQRIHCVPLDAAGATTEFGTPGCRYADLELSPDGRWLLAVEERPREGVEPENRIVAFAASSPAASEAQVVASGHDFVSFPRFSPDGHQLAFTAWNHPDMPWDATQLHRQAWGRQGPAGDAARIAGEAGESIFQPRFSPAGRLSFVSDRSGWWNLYQLRESGAVALCPRAAEFGLPQWVFGLSCYAFVDERTILCRYTSPQGDRLARLDLESGRLGDLDLPFTSYLGVQAEGRAACFLAASPDRAVGVFHLDLESGALTELRSALAEAVEPDLLSAPEARELAGPDGRNVYAFFYPPANRRLRGTGDERPPLLLKSHGGPTSGASSALNLGIQYWTSRGFAVVDVDYGGSTGYGRAYRERLAGLWGKLDVEDCVAAALCLAEEGRVDRARLAISGGSAGGYTTLCALTFHEVFAAGASHYGIGDLEALVRDTHKFESRYLDKLVGPYPERRDLYRERSPIHFTERLACPVIFFQGLEDRVVPPNQAEAMVAALAKRGVPHAYVPFEGEQHGFRQAENIRTALDGELYFYSRVFGFDVERRPPEVRIRP